MSGNFVVAVFIVAVGIFGGLWYWEASSEQAPAQPSVLVQP
jgi:hypothetical protein